MNASVDWGGKGWSIRDLSDRDVAVWRCDFKRAKKPDERMKSSHSDIQVASLFVGHLALLLLLFFSLLTTAHPIAATGHFHAIPA